MNRSNHLVTVPRNELEELERKAELLDALIVNVEGAVVDDILDIHAVNVNYLVKVEKGVLRKIVEKRSDAFESVYNHNLRPRSFQPSVRDDYRVEVVVTPQMEGR